VNKDSLVRRIDSEGGSAAVEHSTAQRGRKVKSSGTRSAPRNEIQSGERFAGRCHVAHGTKKKIFHRLNLVEEVASEGEAVGGEGRQRWTTSAVKRGLKDPLPQKRSVESSTDSAESRAAHGIKRALPRRTENRTHRKERRIACLGFTNSLKADLGKSC